jgi:putative phosphoesterase
MKKILLLSDTHGHLDEAILRHAAEADEIWHAGDWGGGLLLSDRLSEIKPLRGVYGNIDGADLRQVHPETQIFDSEGFQVLMIHIGGYPGHYPASLRQLLKQERPSIFVCGHSHILRVMRDREYNMWCMNPGAAGISGFHKMRTMLRFSLHEGQLLEPAVIELGPRAALRDKSYL